MYTKHSSRSDFDHLIEIHWITNDIISLVASTLQLVFFLGVFAFTYYLTDERLDAHHKAHARGDISILFGCCLVLFVKLILQSVEVEFQRKDGFIILSDAIIATGCYVTIQHSPRSDLDLLIDIHWITNDIISLVASTLQLVFFLGVFAFTYYLTDERLDAHHKAHARGDISILFGCCLVLFVKLILQSVEVEFQRKDGFIILSDAIIATGCYVTIQGDPYLQASQWLQYFSVRRILAMSDRDCRATKNFLPMVALGEFYINSG
ncbi:hypothetical protein OESDEN_04000 [Oesophagostomum dentatum]|uniref:Uncharacterized protein n=1 Tax=Oesophagostomum dentatum TaxID=61180 RepID=A0A0B1TES6_OESDE|nr:hypothetical protein OESDEN_04000 [Oesophagostomum dentatum]